MALRHVCKLFVTPALLAIMFAVAGPQTAEARRVSRWNCPTGQQENAITGICEGQFTGAFIFRTYSYDGPDYYHYRWHRGHRWHRHHRW